METFGTSRGFINGRVDIIRSTSTASVAFVNAMLDPKVPVSGTFISKKIHILSLQNDTKAMALTAAVKALKEFTKDVSLHTLCIAIYKGLMQSINF